MDFFRATINDDEWTIYKAATEDIQSLMDDGTQPAAFVDFDKNEIYFDKNDITLKVVRHEIMHVAMGYLCIEDCGFTSSQLEEIMCDFMAKRLDWFINKSDFVFEQLKTLKVN